MYTLYHCGRCAETFWLVNISSKRCPSCGNTHVSKKELELDVGNKSTTINNVTHGVQDKGLIKINIRGERRKGAFSCNKCGVVFEADCTNGLHTVSCPQCHQKDFESKSPIVSVIGGVAGLPTIKQSWNKKELKKMKFAKSCYLKQLELQNAFSKIKALMNALEFPDMYKHRMDALSSEALSWLEQYHEEKIESYG